ncbi:hypothetical protein MNV49_006472 [Pseudohyphozyma bogoriensis]|nr:hypothetical protein MNV49_006472 [Pseudohyphozyma bogoriensis]
MSVDVSYYLQLLEDTLAALPSDANPYDAVQSLLEDIFTTGVFPAHFRPQLLALAGAFGLQDADASLIILLSAGLVLRLVRNRKTFWVFKVVVVKELRYLAPHAVVAWSSALVVESIVVLVFIYVDLRAAAGHPSAIAAVGPGLIWGLAWLVLGLATWSITLSHFTQRKLEGSSGTLLASPWIVNGVAPLSLSGFIATIVPSTVSIYKNYEKALSTFRDAGTQIGVMGEGWSQGQEFALTDLAAVEPLLMEGMGAVEAAIEKLNQLIYGLTAWTIALVLVFAFIGVIRLKVIHEHITRMPSISASFLSLGSAQGATIENTSSLQRRSLQRTWISLLGMIVLLSGSSLTLSVLAFYGALANVALEKAYLFVMIIFYVLVLFGLPTSVILISMATRSRTPLYLFLAVASVVTWTGFLSYATNNERANSSVVRSLTFQMKASDQVRELLGDNVRLVPLFGQFKKVDGSINMLAGKIDVQFRVAGSEAKGTAIFTSVRRGKEGRFEVLRWKIVRDDGVVLDLSQADPRLSSR